MTTVVCLSSPFAQSSVGSVCARPRSCLFSFELIVFFSNRQINADNWSHSRKNDGLLLHRWIRNATHGFTQFDCCRVEICCVAAPRASKTLVNVIDWLISRIAELVTHQFLHCISNGLTLSCIPTCPTKRQKKLNVQSRWQQAHSSNCQASSWHYHSAQCEDSQTTANVTHLLCATINSWNDRVSDTDKCGKWLKR